MSNRQGATMTRTMDGSARTRSISEQLAHRIGPQKFDMWFGHSTEFHVEGHRLEVRTGSRVAADWIEANFVADLKSVARSELGEDAQVEIRFTPEEPTDPAPGGTGAQIDERAAAGRHVASGRQRPPSGRTDLHLPLRHRLEDFVVGPSNRLAYGAARGVADDDEGGMLGPLFIYGECGLGKTHLLQGICRRLLERCAGAAVRYTTGEQFTNEYIASVRANNIDSFRRRVRQLDLLAIDDVHFFANKKQTQNEFLHTLEAIDLNGARVVMASDEHPRQIQRFSRGLVSRFLAGMVVEVERPDRKTRLEIVRRLAAARRLQLNDAAVEMVATHCVASVREIEGALTQLAAMLLLSPTADVDDRRVGVVLVERLFKDNRQHRGPLRIGAIIDVVCDRLGVERCELMASGRHRRVVLARGMVSLLSRELTTMSYPEIARAIGRRNHSTVLTAGKRIKQQLEAGESVLLDAGAAPFALRELVDQLRHEIVYRAH